MWLSLLLLKRSPDRGSKPHAARRPPTRIRPRLEGLEDRWLPSQVGLTITSLADSGPGSLRAAILSADACSQKDQFTIGFAVKGTIDLQTPLPDLNNSIAIQGPGASSLTVMRDSAFLFTSAIITVDAGQAASLSGLTVANGNNLSGSGGGIINLGVLTVSGCTLAGNSAGNDGGGIFNLGGTLTVSNSTLKGNSADGDAGGGIVNWEGTLTVSASTVCGNSAAVGGGIFNIFGSATINRSTLSGNTAEDGGGIDNGGTQTVSGCTLAGNTATGFDFGGHHFAGEGGGLFNASDSTTTVRDSLFSGNFAELGGAIYNNAPYGVLVVRGSTFSGNSASDSGGAVYNNAGTVTVQESTLSGNSAGSAGGGIFNGASGALAVKDSTALTDVAPLGADLYSLGALALDDSTVGVIGS
jgi:predicted outer membrane repeat protein